MLRPLALMVQLASGWRFTPNAAGEWQSLGAGLVLVKACAGINFMILSLLGWCWIVRPGRVREAGASVRSLRPAWTPWLEWPVLMAGALALAWAMALAVNTVRILAIVHWQPALERWLPHEEAHRMLGLLVYLPAFCLQLVVGERRHWRAALLAGCALYAVLMLGVPLVTGNAMANPQVFGSHAVRVLAALLPLLLLATWRRRDAGASADAVGSVPSTGSENSMPALALCRGGNTSCHRASQQPPCLRLPPTQQADRRTSGPIHRCPAARRGPGSSACHRP